MSLLLAAGADMRAKNKDGFTPLDFAKVGSEVHEIMMEARHGDLPEIERNARRERIIQLHTLCNSFHESIVSL